jgi:predicted esterase
LSKAGVDLDLRWQNSGHALTYEEVEEAREWLAGVLPKLVARDS